jgi:hypothetical protein
MQIHDIEALVIHLELFLEGYGYLTEMLILDTDIYALLTEIESK